MSLYTGVIYAATTRTRTSHLLLPVCNRTHHRICIYFTSHYIVTLLTDTVYLCAYYITAQAVHIIVPFYSTLHFLL